MMYGQSDGFRPGSIMNFRTENYLNECVCDKPVLDYYRHQISPEGKVLDMCRTCGKRLINKQPIQGVAQ